MQKYGKFEIEYRIRNKNGDIKWVWERGTGIQDIQNNNYKNDKIQFIDGIITDISDIKKKEINKNSENLQLENFIKRKTKELRISYDNLRKERKRIQSLLKITKSQFNTEEELLKMALDECIRLTESEGGYFYLIDNKIPEIHLAKIGFFDQKSSTIVYKKQHSVEWKDFLKQKIIKNKQDNKATQIPTLKNFEKHLKEIFNNYHKSFNRYISLPIKTQSSPVAVIGLINKQSEYNNEDIEQLELFSTSIIQILSKERAFEQLEQAKKLALKKDKAKSKFLADMSHELRNPLNSIMGFSDILLQGLSGEMPDEQTEIVENIFDASTHLLEIINEILDISKIEAGKMDFKPEECDFSEIINKILIYFDKKIKQKQIKLFVHYNHPKNTIFADKQKIKQILMNLISNAIKFTKKHGAITIGVRQNPTELEQGNENSFLIYVKDNGIGIKKEDQHKLFTAYQQIHDRDSNFAVGTGLGLELCKKFINMHGGEIWVESTYGKGSSFKFTIPQN